MRVLALLLFLPSLAFGQSGSMSLDSMRATFGAGQRSISASVQPVRIDPLTGASTAITGQSVSLGTFDIFTTATLRADFPGQKSTPMVVSALRLVFTGSGLGWKVPDNHPAWVDIPVTTVIVPAGKGIGYRYDMPAIGKGSLQWVVGASAASIPSPIVTGPVVIGPITPPPLLANSLPGDCSPPLPQLTLGGIWTVTGGVVSKDKVPLTANAYPDLQTICVDENSAIRAFNKAGVYETWNPTTNRWQ